MDSGSSLNRGLLDQFTIVEKQNSNSKTLHVRALLPFYSSEDIGAPETNEVGDTLHVNVPITGSPCPKGHGADIDFHISVPLSIKRVVFGTDKTEIWPKDVRAIPFTRLEQAVRDAAVKQYRVEFPDKDIADTFIGIYEQRPRPDDPNILDAGNFKVFFFPYKSSGGKYAEYLVSSQDAHQVPKRFNPTPLPKDAVQSAWIGVCEYRGYEKRENITFDNAPTAKFHCTETIRGPNLDSDIRIQYQFSEYPSDRKPDGWTFSEEKLPEVGSKWILFIQDLTSAPGAGFKTLRGSSGRLEASEDNVENVHRAIEEYYGQH